MKKFIGLFLTLLLCLSLVAVTAYAAAPSATMTGPDAVRAGDTINISYTLTCENISTILGNLDFDTSQLTLIGTKQELGSAWDMTANGNKILVEDSKFTSPINGTQKVLTFTFLVNKDIAEGAEVAVKFTDVTATSLSEEFVVPEAVFSATIAKPLSKDSNLKELTVSNATISPAFDPATTSYTTSVPFSVSKLDLSYAANDEKATVTVNNPTLTAGSVTTVSVTVTAEDGSTKTYSIKVQRAKDPNYVASGNNYLSEIKVTEFRLSPVFNKETTSYLIWLPYEVDRVSVTGKAEDANATVKVQGGDNLIAGADNEIKVVCTAENGETRTYTIIAKRAAAHNAQPTQPTEPSTQPTTPPSTAPSTGTTEPSRDNGTSEPDTTEPADEDDGTSVSTVLLILYIVIGVIALGGIIVCVLFIVGSKNTGKFSK